MARLARQVRRDRAAPLVMKGKLAQRVRKVIKDCKARRAYLVRRVIKVRLVRQAPLAPLVCRMSPARQVRPARKVHRVRLVLLLMFPVPRVRLVRRAWQAHPARLVLLLIFPARLAQLALLAPRVRLVCRALKAIKACRDRRVCKASRATKAYREFKALPVRKALQARRDNPYKDRPALQALAARKVRQARLAAWDRKAPLARLAHQALPLFMRLLCGWEAAPRRLSSSM